MKGDRYGRPFVFPMFKDAFMSRDIVIRIILSLFIIFLIFALHRAITVAPRPDQPVFAADRPLLFAHRGGADLWPENTLFAFERAAAMGADVLELDVRLTADGELVVMHDASVDRTTNGKGKVRDMTLAELKQLDAGYRFTPDDGATYPYRGQGIAIPTLAEVFRAFPSHIINIEIKDYVPEAVERLVELIEANQAENRVIVSSFDDETMKYFRRLAPHVANAAAPGEIRIFYIFSRLRLTRFHRPLSDAYQIPVERDGIRLDTKTFIDAAHSKNQKVHYWTIDDPEEMRRLLSLGADGVMTDRPDLALDVFREFGYK